VLYLQEGPWCLLARRSSSATSEDGFADSEGIVPSSSRGSLDRPPRQTRLWLQAAAQFTPLHSKRIWEGISRDCALQTSKERASQIRTIDFERSLGTRGLHSVTLTCFAESLNVLAHAKSPAMSEQFSSQQKLNEDPSYKSNRINRR